MTEHRPHRVAACLIVKDEEARLPAALASLDFCDEIVVVDGGSRDRTVVIAREAGATVVEHSWAGFAAQRNVALDHASAEWVLEMDADETVGGRLRESIERFLTAPPEDVEVVAMALLDVFLGRELTAANHYPNYRFRLMRRGSHRHDERRTVHEGILPRGRVWALEGDIHHVLADTLAEAWTDMHAYARLAARQVPQPLAPRAVVAGTAVRPVLKFVYRLLVVGGWRDGWPGALWIARDCLSDVLVWLYALRRRGDAPLGEPGALRWHFEGEWVPPGPPRVVAVARGHHHADRARRWLSRARQGGCDVALVTDADAQPSDGIWARAQPRLGLLHLIRALEAERQLRQTTAVVAAGWRERLLLALTPARLRGHRRPLTLATPPGALAARLGQSARCLPVASRPRLRGRRGCRSAIPLVPEFAAGRLGAETPLPTWWPVLRRLEIAHAWARSPVLDVGAGTGWLTLHLQQWGHDVTACDWSEPALANFRENMRIAGRDLTIAKQDVCRLSYEDERFASVFCISVLAYVPDLERALDELWRVLRPGGIAVIGCLNAYGSFAFLFDRDPRTLFRHNRYRADIRQDVEHFYGPRRWQREFARRFTVLEAIPLEVLSPAIARFRGYDVDPRWTRADTRLAARLPKEFASEVVFILQK